jgi:hypothetical protein
MVIMGMEQGIADLQHENHGIHITKSSKFLLGTVINFVFEAFTPNFGGLMPMTKTRASGLVREGSAERQTSGDGGCLVINHRVGSHWHPEHFSKDQESQMAKDQGLV